MGIVCLLSSTNCNAADILSVISGEVAVPERQVHLFFAVAESHSETHQDLPSTFY